MVARVLLLVLLALTGLGPGLSAHADVDNGFATNVQEGDNEHSSDQSGEAQSGDAVVGQTAGVVSSGDASVDATNSTEDSEAETGDAQGHNSVSTVVGLINSGCGAAITVDICPAADVTNVLGTNVQEGDNVAETVQAATVASGDGVAGQVVGLVASGTADLVMANGTESSDIETGDADFNNESAATVLHFSTEGPCCVLPSFVASGDTIDVS